MRRVGRTVWPLVGRSTELSVARAALANGVSVVTAGRLGVGRTRLADEVLADGARGGAAVVRLAVTRAAATIPYGAAGPLLAAVGASPSGAPAGPGPSATEGAGRPSANAGGGAPGPSAGAPRPSRAGPGDDTVVATRRAVADRHADAPLLLAVDDAHLLDEATAGLLDTLLADGHVRLVMTVTTGVDPLPRHVARLWEGRRWRRIELAELTRDVFRDLVGGVLDGEVEGATVDRLWDATRGNVLFLRELCRDALDAGTLARHHGVWTWSAVPVAGPRLHDLVTSRIGALSAQERHLAGALALGEPLPMELAQVVAAPEVIDALGDRGLVVVERAEGRRMLRFAHPLYADGVRAQLGPLESADLYATLVRGTLARYGAHLAGSPDPTTIEADERLRLGIWSISSNVSVDPGLLAAAATDALRRDDPALAERLARAALGQAPSTGVAQRPPTVPATRAGFRAALTLGEALSMLRRPEEAEDVLAPLAAMADDDRRRARVALVRLLALRLQPDRTDHARAIAASTGITHPVAADMVRAGLAAMLSHAGAVAEGGAMALELLRSSDIRVRLQALPPAATWLIHAGRADAAVREAEGVIAGVGAPLRREDLLRARGWTTTAATVALVTAGRLDEAEAALASAMGDPMSRPVLDGGTMALLRGRLALAQGRPATARRALGEAALALGRSDPLGRYPWVLALLAEAHALLGDTADARAALGERAAAFDNNRLSADARRAEVWVTAIEGDVAGAAEQAMALADEAAAEGYAGFELVYLVEATRLGALGVAGRLVEVAGRVEGPLARVHADLAPALVAGDGARLDDVADRLAALGVMLPAAEAATHASRAHRRAGALRHARASADRAQDLLGRCEGAWTPALAGGSALDDLTPREREVVLLAARGLSSRAIADRFGVSVRTIDNQLGRAYRKLGIASRAELSALLDAALPPAKGA